MTVGKRLITECNFEDVQNLVEDVNGTKTLFIEGIFMQSQKQNRNGRIYPKSILEREANRFVTEYVDKKRALGELNHPAGPTINLDKVSHMITEMKQDGDNFIGKAKILDTPMGNIARKLIEGGANLGVSTRGLGSVKNSNGVMVVQEDFNLATVDIVSNPSGIDCWVNGIMEGVEWVFIDGMLQERHIEEIKKDLDKAKLNEEAILKAWSKYLKPTA